MTIDLSAWQQRIGYSGLLEPTSGVLREIHWAHLQHVPFENLDIRPLRRPLDLDLAALERKIVHSNRGGFCFELNGLLGEALTQIGFEVQFVEVRFVHDEGTLGPELDHMAVIVCAADDPRSFLADVGCGRSSPARPLPLVHGHIEHQPETGFEYQMRAQGDEWRLSLREADKEWRQEYAFREIGRSRSDFMQRCVELQTGDGSHFTSGPICSRNLPGGRVSVSDGKLIVTRDDERIERELPDQAAFDAVLWEHFGIRLEYGRS